MNAAYFILEELGAFEMIKPVRIHSGRVMHGGKMGILEGFECWLRHSGRIRRCGRGRAPLPSFLKALSDTFDARSPFDMCSFWKEKAWFNLWT